MPRSFNDRTGTSFNNLQFPSDIVLLPVLWHLRYKLGFRDVAELLMQRGFVVSYETIRTWEFRFAPVVSEHLRNRRRHDGHGKVTTMRDLGIAGGTTIPGITDHGLQNETGWERTIRLPTVF
jgi:hypothetical protein